MSPFWKGVLSTVMVFILASLTSAALGPDQPVGADRVPVYYGGMECFELGVEQ